MVELKDYASPVRPTWCPGCGDFGVWNAMKRALVEAELAPHEVVIYTGIGCGSKLPDYMTVNGFTSIHGRPIPVAQGSHLANHGLKAIVVAGDGDTYGIGGNHFIQACRRNADITIVVQDNRRKWIAGAWEVDNNFQQHALPHWDTLNGVGLGPWKGNVTIDVPEPATLSLLGLGALALIRRKRT